jgi:hypothetical protein
MNLTDPLMVKELDKFKFVNNAGRKIKKGHTVANMEDLMSNMGNNKLQNVESGNKRSNWIDALITIPFRAELSVGTNQEDKLGFVNDLLNEF